MKKFYSWIMSFGKTKVAITAAALIIVVGGAFAIFHKSSSPSTLITVTQGSITETVSVTGNTTPMQSVALAFQNSGTVASTNFAVGDTVAAGQVVASLNADSIYAQLKQAQANVDAAQATLEGLQAGSRPEDIAASQAALDQANQDLLNMYGSINNSSSDAYAKATDAVRTQLSVFFTNGDTSNPQLTFQTTNSQAAISANTDRAEVTTALSAWQSELDTVSASSSQSNLSTLLTNGVSTLSTVRTLLSDVSNALNGASLSSATLASYKTDVTTALGEVNIASTNLTTASQNIASQQAVVAEAQANLALKQAGSTPQSIASQQATVEAAQANVESIQANIANTQIVAPISGVITQMDAKVGQIASPGTTLVSIISANAYEVDAYVPETDIGKVAVGNPVDMTFDAFPGETFAGTVFYIDPAQTITQGVVDYKVKVSFTTVDPRIKSGLTANLNIKTQQKNNVLILPQYAILQTDQGNFVEVLKNCKVENDPVTLGIQDEQGNVEITSGVTAGEQVENIGLK